LRVLHPGGREQVQESISIEDVCLGVADGILTSHIVFPVLPKGVEDWDIDFLPKKPISSPASYEPAPRKMLERPSTMLDVADFSMEYISSDVHDVFSFHLAS
jgi:hypothetical protein